MKKEAVNIAAIAKKTKDLFHPVFMQKESIDPELSFKFERLRLDSQVKLRIKPSSKGGGLKLQTLSPGRLLASITLEKLKQEVQKFKLREEE